MSEEQVQQLKDQVQQLKDQNSLLKVQKGQLIYQDILKCTRVD